MTAKELAAALNGIEYPCRISNELLSSAKEYGLVIVYGQSDDLIEFEAAIADEAGVYDGDTVRIDSKGIIPDFSEVDHEVEACRKWMARDTQARTIEALWCKEPGYSWTYKTDIPHETFEVMEDGEHYCRGLVFSLSDL
jgi:hypothetical protein